MSTQAHPSDDEAADIDVVELANRLVHTGWPWVSVWLLSRCWMLRSWSMHYSYIANDVRYYFWQLTQGHDLSVVLREYPLPVLWLLDLLRWPAGNQMNIYVVVFALAMAVMDAGFSLWLWRAHSQLASIFWLAFGFMIGPLIWFRYDLVPGVVVGAAVLYVATRPRTAGALVACGAAIKLWPALLIAPLVGRDRPSQLRLGGFTVAGLVLAGLAFLDAGFARLVSPLTWQSDRGLQIESVFASILMWNHRDGHPHSTIVTMSKYNAYEVFGPGVVGWQHASSVCMAVSVLLAVAVAVLSLTRPVEAHQRAMAAAMIVTLMIVANKTLSPQYMVWLGAVVAAWLAVTPRGAQRLRPALAAALTMVLGAMTQYIYPHAYSDLVGGTSSAASVTAVLVGRNLGLVVLGALLVWWTFADLLRRPRD